MTAELRAPSITPALVLGLGDFADRVIQALGPEIGAAPPAVQAALRCRSVTWPEGGALRVADQAGRALLELGAGEPDPLIALRGLIEKELCALGSHATYERLLRAGYGSPDDPASSRPPRCYLVGALGEAAVAECLVPLLAQLNALSRPGNGPPPIAAFLNVATLSLDPHAPQRRAVGAALQALPEVIAAPSPGGVWPCVLIDWVKAGGVLAEGHDELCVALVALLRVLLLADEPATLLNEVLSKPPIEGHDALFSSVGVSVIQSPPHEAVVDWLASRLMAEFLSRRCLNPLPASPSRGTGPPSWVRHLDLRTLLEALAQGMAVQITPDLRLQIPALERARREPLKTVEVAAPRIRQTLVDQVARNRVALHTRLFAGGSQGELDGGLARELEEGPHRLRTVQADLEQVQTQLASGQKTLGSRLDACSVAELANRERVQEAQDALRSVRETVPGSLVLFVRTVLLALVWGGVFGTWAGRLSGAGEGAGALLAALLLVAAIAVWRLAFKQRQIRRAQHNSAAQILERERAAVEQAWLAAGQATLDRAQAWHAQQVPRMRDLGAQLARVKSALATYALQLPSDPIIVETLPYLDGYVEWLQPELQRDPFMIAVQQHLERDPGLAGWPDLSEEALCKALIGVGVHSFTHVPELSAETVLANRSPEIVRSHLERLRHLALPLIDLRRAAMRAATGEPSTLDLACWEHRTAMRLDHWPDRRWQESTHVVSTGDPRRVTFVRILPAFGLEDLADPLCPTAAAKSPDNQNLSP